MKIKLNRIDDDDWFTIVRVEHDGKCWMEQTGKNSFRYMCSERLSPEACIEGTAYEMVALAHAIKNQGMVSFKRCAVHFEEDGVHLRSPKNSERDAVVTREEASDLADQILTELVIAD
jgi:hypothetical protein